MRSATSSEGRPADPAGAPRRRLSVVIPALNEEERLPALCDSLARGTGSDRPDEVIVVDGGSRDGTVSVAERAGATVLTSRPGRGLQLQAGAGRASGDVVLFLHADARVEEGAIRAVRAAYDDPTVVATGMRQRIDGSRRIYRWIERAANRRVRFGRVYGDSGLAVRRDAYDEVGGFRDLPLFEDLDLSRRLRRRGRVRLVEDAVLSISARRWERAGALRQTLRNWLLTLAWAAGVHPSRLVRYYLPHSTAVEQP